MLKRLIFFFLVILAGCSNPPESKEKTITNDSHVKRKTATVKPAANPWTISSFAPKEGQTEGNKFVRIVTEGDFSDSTGNNNYLYAEVLVNKTNAGIFLHELKKSSPAEKFSEPVQIKMTNSEGKEILMNSTRRWNSSGGIMIEGNNGDYSQFRVFMLQSKGTIPVEIKDSGNKIYYLNINADGFSDSFARL
jgi:hypothetical protein